MPDITLVEAVTQALAYELAKDENVVVFGEDVGKMAVFFGQQPGCKSVLVNAEYLTPLWLNR